MILIYEPDAVEPRWTYKAGAYAGVDDREFLTVFTADEMTIAHIKPALWGWYEYEEGEDV
jgi:hypothetical protein